MPIIGRWMKSEAKKYVGAKKEYDTLVRKRKKNPRLEMLESLAGGLPILKIIP